MSPGDLWAVRRHFWRRAGNMVSPQNLIVGTGVTRLQGTEGDRLRMVLKWSIGPTGVMAILMVLRAYVLEFMVP